MSEIPVAEAQAERRESFARTTHIFFGSVPWGYGWIIPHGDLLNVGVGGNGRQSAGYQEALRELLRGYFLPGTAECANLRGHVLPYGRFQRAPGRWQSALGRRRGRTRRSHHRRGHRQCLGKRLVGVGVPSRKRWRQATRRKPERSITACCARASSSRLDEAAMARWLLYPRPCLPLAMRTLRKHPLCATVLPGAGRADFLRAVFRPHAPPCLNR